MILNKALFKNPSTPHPNSFQSIATYGQPFRSGITALVLLLGLFAFTAQTAQAQCTGCTQTLGNTNNYSPPNNGNHTICIPAGVVVNNIQNWNNRNATIINCGIIQGRISGNRGELINNGTINLNQQLNVNNQFRVENYGTFNAPGLQLNSGSRFEIGPNGDINLSGCLNLASGSRLISWGTLDVACNLTINNGVQLTLGAQTNISGNVTAMSQVEVAGIWNITGNLTAQNGANIRGHNNSGGCNQLNVGGSITLLSGAKIGGSGAPLQVNKQPQNASVNSPAFVGSSSEPQAIGSVTLDNTATTITGAIGASGVNGVLVLSSLAGPVNALPADNTSYQVGDSIGNSEVVAVLSAPYSSPAFSQPITACNTHHYRVVAYNGGGGCVNYASSATAYTDLAYTPESNSTGAATWTGAEDAAYTNPDNWLWSDGVACALPSCNNNVTIPAGAAPSPVLDSVGHARDLTIASGATLEVTTRGELFICRDIDQGGSLNFPGELHLVGNVTQTLSGNFSGANKLDRLVVDMTNGGSIQLQTQVEVVQAIHLLHGPVYTNSYSLELQNTNPDSLTYSNQSYVVGRLNRAVAGVGVYNFPVGDASNLQRCQINITQDLGPAVQYLEAEFFDEVNNNNGLPATEVNRLIEVRQACSGGFWRVEPDGQPNENCEYDFNAWPQGFSCSDSLVILMKRDNPTAPWQVNPGRDNCDWANRFVSRQRLTSFSDFAPASGPPAAPLNQSAAGELEIIRKPDAQTLAWSVYTNEPSGYWRVYGLDETGRVLLQEGGWRKSPGQLRLQDALHGLALKPRWRAYQVEVYADHGELLWQGQRDYTPPEEVTPWRDQAVATSGLGELRLPNPRPGESASLVLYSAAGRQVWAQQQTTAANQLQVDLPELSAGMYVLQGWGSGWRRSAKIWVSGQ